MKLIIFDLDGTLLNTIDDLADSVNHTLDELGLATYTVNEVKQMVGNGVEMLMRRALTEKHLDLLETAVDKQRKYYVEHSLDKTRPYDGILPMMKELRNLGIKVGVFSNKDDTATQKLCKVFFDGLADYCLGTKLHSAKKPDPFGVNAIVKLAGVSLDDTYYCGDSDVDLLTAQNAHVPCISVTWGFRSREFLKQNGATLFADHPSQIVQLAKSEG